MNPQRSSVVRLALGVAGLALFAALVWSLARLLGSLPETADPTWMRIRETGVLRVCTDPSWPPFEYLDARSGQLQGFDIELARLLVQRLAPGVRAQMVTVGFDGLYDALLAGRCDAVISALPYEPLRTEDISYSIAYFDAGLVLVTHQETMGISRIDDLQGRTIAVEWGFVPEGDGRQQLFFEDLGLRRYDSPNAALRALQAGEVEVAVVDRIAALTYLGDCEGLKIVGRPITDVHYVIPVRPDSFFLLARIDQALLAMREDGTLERLQDQEF